MVLVLAIVASMISLGTAKVTQAAISSTTSNKVTLQAQSYAESKAGIIKSISYSDLTSQSKAVISNSDNFYDEVIIGNESTYPSDKKIKQKECLIHVYKGSETVPRATLRLMRYSVEASSIPQGTILSWFGQLSNIPSGFAVCDGKNGTPDLRNRFIVGAGDSYNFGDTGGSSSVLLSEANIANHRHLMFVPGYRTLGKGYFYQSLSNSTYVSVGGNSSSGSCEEKYNMVSAGSSTAPSIGLTGYAGTTSPQPFDNRPPYYSLYYIMKL